MPLLAALVPGVVCIVPDRPIIGRWSDKCTAGRDIFLHSDPNTLQTIEEN